MRLTIVKSRAIVLPLIILCQLLMLSQANAQQKTSTVTGVVSNEKNLPLPNVTVVVRNAETNFMAGTTTDTAGVFSFNNLQAGGPYNFSFSVVSYKAQNMNGYTLKAGASLSLVVTLQEIENSLDQVVVVGYGTRKKSEVTSSIVSINAEDIRSRPVTNAMQALQGKAAGIDITSNERPGEMGKVLIRGVRSLASTLTQRANDPLYVVDGIPLNFGNQGNVGAINPNDIETIDVLKDASATAIYGSRGANGVVLITTKKGKKGTINLDYVGTLTVEDIQDRMDLMNAGQYIELRRDAYRRAKYLDPKAIASATYPDAPTITDDQRLFGTDTYAWENVKKGWANGSWDGSLVNTTDWRSLVKQTGITNDHTISISGGSDKIRAYASFGYLKQKGTQLGQDYTRYSSKFNIEITPLKWFSMGTSITATYGLQNYGFSSGSATGPGSLYAAAAGMLPFAVPYDNDGKRINLPGGDININSPIGEENYNINLRKNLRGLGAFHIDFTPINGLRYRVSFGPDYNNFYNGRYQDSMSINRGSGQPGSSNYAQLNQDNSFAWTLDHLLTYNKSLGGGHDFGASFLYSSTKIREETSSITASKLPWSSQKWYALNSVGTPDAYSSGLTERSLLSYMGRLNYSYKGKYYLDVYTRGDGASQLAEGHKWDVFPAASLAWRVSEEPFMQSVSWLSSLKLRAGVGSVGNATVNPYTTKGALQTLYYTWGSAVDAGYVSSDPSSANPVSLPNKTLKWERTTQANVGIDFRVLNGRIDGTVDLYTSRTKDLLMLRLIPSISGYTQSLDNVGVTANRGIDVSLNTVNLQLPDFTWNSTINFSATRDRVVETAYGKNDDRSNRWFIGKPLNIFYDYQYEGIWQESEKDELQKNWNPGLAWEKWTTTPGMIKAKDLNGDYKVDANNDYVIVGRAQPKWNGGITNEFNYKNWSLNVFVFARWGFTVESGAESLQGRYAQRVVDYWTPSNTGARYPAPNYANATGDARRTALNYQDGSFVKIRNISLSYRMPKGVIDRLKMKNCRLYAQAMNPGLIYSRVDWIDPDLGGSTWNRGFVFGVNAGF
ncbi:SusC/RagA family TonB-linked outer membrane protein [Niastella sp. OAS944]|uniref:SusC/RagA family TonB-linked outer membrane protein n=1 Tax=Niastella sp. OAS944 TaxID=2664089 RepID=UPI00348EAA4A|nr:TonB-linked SusC/RagA family outer membrane protein [Chitinophagaceae bacterium OAS944]